MIYSKKIEDKILDYLKSGLSVDEILKKDDSFPIYCTFSKTRENILNWYPFKNDCTVLIIGDEYGSLLSLLCKKSKNVTTIIKDKKCEDIIKKRFNNFKNFKTSTSLNLSTKFDYVILIGSLENLETIKKLVKSSGKVLLCVDNRFALKYWCGTKEEQSGEVFATFNRNTILNLYSKAELEKEFDKYGLKYNFYYPLPDYKFPEVILTDKVLENNINHTYNPYYSSKTKTIIREKDIFSEILRNNELSFFANSYLIELSDKKSPIEIEYVKLNNFRYPEYATITYKKDNKYYKKAMHDEGLTHINNLNKYYNILTSHGVKTVKVIKEKDECYTPNVKSCYSLMDKLNELYLSGEIKEVYSEINKYINYLKKHFKEDKNIKETIFEKYDLKISSELKNSLTFTKDGFIDLCFQNLLFDKKEYVAIDQEWYLESVPIEFIIYRSIHLFVFNNMDITNKPQLYKDILDNISVDLTKFTELFDNLEDKFISRVINYNADRNAYSKYNFLINSSDLSSKITDAIDNYELYLGYKNENKQKDQLIKEQKNEIDKMIRLIHEKDDQFVSLGNNYNALEKQKNLIENQKNVLENELKRLNSSFFVKVLKKLHLIKK